MSRRKKSAIIASDLHRKVEHLRLRFDILERKMNALHQEMVEAEMPAPTQEIRSIDLPWPQCSLVIIPLAELDISWLELKGQQEEQREEQT